MDHEILDVIVNGPGFGETIFIGWWEGGQKNWGMVDCFAVSNGRAIVPWFKALSIDSLRFLVLTHPHLDHVYNVAEVLRALPGGVERVWWWGGLAASTYIAFFEKVDA